MSRRTVQVEAGDKYDRWTVVGSAPTQRTRGGVSCRYVTCKCECGTVRDVQLASLRAGVSRSCGCLQRDAARNCKPSLTHGLSKTTLHVIWSGIKARCYNPNSEKYPIYGGRGIQMFAEWRDNFDAFAKYMGPRPAGMSVDRIDSNGNYEPGNVRWATTKQQARNRRSSVEVLCDGKRQPLREACETLGLNYETTRRGLHKHGTYRGLTKVNKP